MADCPHAVEHEAQRIAGQLVVRSAQASGAAAGPTDVQPLDVDSLRLLRPRSVGVEQPRADGLSTPQLDAIGEVVPPAAPGGALGLDGDVMAWSTSA